MSQRTMQAIVYTIFVLSGAAGLIYESIWARYLSLFVGHSAYAQILVLTIFLGGMAGGAWLAGERSKRLRDPLRAYAFIELAVGLIGLVFHELYLGVTGFAYDAIFPVLSGGWLAVAKWVIAGALILPQSVMLGATFPLMGAGTLRRVPDRMGRTLALLYFANSIGAALGVLVAGFYLLSLAGLPGTVLTAAMLNLVVAAVALTVARYAPAGAPADEAPPPVTRPATSEPVPAPAGNRLWYLLLGVSFGTAVASFIYEISWLRMLALVLGSATHSFELMLSAFILGLALGSLWVRTRVDRWADPLRALGVVQWVMGFAALATLPLYAASFGWLRELIQTFARTDGGYTGFTLSRYAICVAVMVPSTFCAGITLPLITRTLLAAGRGERAIGAVYGANTVGSIVGVGLAGVVLLPLIGVRWTLVAGATLDMALGVVLIAAATWRRAALPRLAYGMAVGTVVLAGVAGATGVEQRILTSGVFRLGTVMPPGSVDMLFYKDGRTATVAVSRHKATGHTAIDTNGKTDGSLPAAWLEPCADSTVRRPIVGDIATQTLLPLMVLAHAPDARSAAVIGHGTGMSSHTLLGSPVVERVTTIEIEPEMIRGSRAFYPANRRVFDDPRSVHVIEDARAYLAAGQERYDLILSEPSNPWVSGVASLFTSEFYGHVKRYLAPDAVFGQWIHRWELTDGLLLTVLAALHENFPAYEIFQTGGNDLLIVAGTGQTLRAPDWSIVEWPEIARDLCHAMPLTPQALEATRVIHRAALAPLLRDWGQPNSDYYPVLDLGAERARFMRERAEGLSVVAGARFDVTAPFFGRRRLPGTEASVPIVDVPRLMSRAVGAALRHQAVVEVGPLAPPREFAAARYRQDLWELTMRSPTPPADWRLWLQDFRLVENDRDGGTAGYADETFYRAVAAYLARHRAPQEVLDAVRFHHGLAAWDFAEASRAVDALADGARNGEGWIDVEELLVGAVVAKLRVGDVTGAVRIHQRLAPHRRQPMSLRSELVDAYLVAFAAADDR